MLFTCVRFAGDVEIVVSEFRKHSEELHHRLVQMLGYCADVGGVTLVTVRETET